MNAICNDTKIDNQKTNTMHRIVPVFVIKQSVLGLIRLIADLNEKRRSRHALSLLTAEQLKDIGVSATEARQEASRSFWS